MLVPKSLLIGCLYHYLWHCQRIYAYPFGRTVDWLAIKRFSIQVGGFVVDDDVANLQPAVESAGESCDQNEIASGDCAWEMFGAPIPTWIIGTEGMASRTMRRSALVATTTQRGGLLIAWP